MSKKILFIEDEMRLQEALGAKLRIEGYEMISALDGDSGLKIAEEQRPDLILLDLVLPKKDGFKVLEEIRLKPEIKDIPVIVLSNLEGRQDIERVVALGVQSYLAKANYTLEEVVEKIKEVFK